MSTLEDNYKRSCDELAKAKEALNTANALLYRSYKLLDCNLSFHRLGGIDDCEPCKLKKEIEQHRGRNG